MAKSITDFWKRAAADIKDTSSILDTSAVLDVRQVLDTSGVLGMREDEENKYNGDDWNSKRELVTHFVLCNSEINENSIDDDLEKLAFRFEKMINGIFRQVLEINTNFTFSFCRENKLEEGLNFTNIGDFETKRSAITSYNLKRLSDKNFTNKRKLDRGIKVIEVLPVSTDLSLHSYAEKNGIVAHVYLHHLNKGGFRNDVGLSVRQFKLVEFDITIIHEICHLLGLSDRYQFLLEYKLGTNGDCIESITRTLIPYAVNPQLDEEALDELQVLNNLMYGIDNFCLSLTIYQKKVILGYLETEPDYDKVSVLIPQGSKFSTNTYNNRAKKRTGLSRTEKDDAPIVGVDPSLGTFTYTYIDGILKQDFSGQNIILDGKAVGNKLNEIIGIIVLDENGNVQSSSNTLGKDILNLNYCDGRTINPVKSNSTGN